MLECWRLFNTIFYMDPPFMRFYKALFNMLIDDTLCIYVFCVHVSLYVDPITLMYEYKVYIYMWYIYLCGCKESVYECA